MRKTTRLTTGQVIPLRYLKGRVPTRRPFRDTTTNNEDEVRFFAYSPPEPLFVVRRVDKDTARVETVEGQPYSQPMPIAEAVALVRGLEGAGAGAGSAAGQAPEPDPQRTPIFGAKKASKVGQIWGQFRPKFTHGRKTI